MGRRRINRDPVDSFIEGAKSSLEEEKVKTFLLRLPYKVWKEAKACALEEDMTLHDYLVSIIKNHLKHKSI